MKDLIYLEHKGIKYYPVDEVARKSSGGNPVFIGEFIGAETLSNSYYLRSNILKCTSENVRPYDNVLPMFYEGLFKISVIAKVSLTGDDVFTFSSSVMGVSQKKKVFVEENYVVMELFYKNEGSAKLPNDIYLRATNDFTIESLYLIIEDFTESEEE